jgi:hypothetical protein
MNAKSSQIVVTNCPQRSIIATATGPPQSWLNFSESVCRRKRFDLLQEADFRQ